MREEDVHIYMYPDNVLPPVLYVLTITSLCYELSSFLAKQLLSPN